MGTKITNLPQVATPTGSDELPISQDNGVGGRDTYKATLDQIKNYVKSTGGTTGTVTSVELSSTDGSIDIFGSPIVDSGTILLTISSVGLDKLKDGGATNGEVLTYDGSTSTWTASGIPKELPQTASNGDILTYDSSTSTWVASGLSAQGFNVSLSSNGYQKLPSGLIMQWGVLSSVSLDQTWHLVNLPITFPNQIFNASATLSYDTIVNGSIGTIIKELTLSSFSIAGDHSTDTTTGDIYWQAIGF
jgi:hypothetical protein